MNKRYFTILLLFLPLLSQAQYSFTFMPEVQGRTLEGLMMVKVFNAEARKSFNAGSEQRIRLQMRVDIRRTRVEIE